MTRGRAVVVSSLAVVGIGALAALGSLALEPARASVGPLPASALTLPADTTFLMGLDVKRFAASPLYKRLSGGPNQVQALTELERRTGLRPDRDVDSVVVAGQKAPGPTLALVSARFDRDRLAQAIEGANKDVTHRTETGVTLYSFATPSSGPGALAFLDDHTLLLGSGPAVEGTLKNRPQASKGLGSNTALMELVGRVKPGTTFWMVGDQSLLANLPKTISPGLGAGSAEASSLNLPALKTLMITGDMDPALAFEVTGDTADEASAKSLADILKGFLAIAALQAKQKPEFQQLASSVSVTTEASRVHLSAEVPYTLLDSLQPRTAPPVAPRKNPAGPGPEGD